MVDYTALAATAKRLVEENGRTVTLRKANRTPDDAAEPWKGTSVAPNDPQLGDSESAIVAFVPASGSGLGRLVFDVTGQQVSRFDQVGLLAATTVPGIQVEDFDFIHDDDDSVWKIVEVGYLRPSTTGLLWVMGLKR